MQIFNTFTENGNTLIQSVHLDRENACLVIAESDGENRKELIIDLVGAEALRDAIRQEIDEADDA